MVFDWYRRREAEKAEREHQEYIRSTYEAFPQCANCGWVSDRGMRIAKGISVEEFLQGKICPNCKVPDCLR